ncbi:outer membrane beta-barrel protein [Bartonella sp. 1-1C]|uniref:outer membrane beta-barrel protein n=1 Tax=Bartonella sp. 1-1C TaxID=515256 RepID=UPI0001F4C817|nr:outer membrane beta-barrel protein [Bartonella sp. 1-1C]ATO56856.1 outer membrane immunogenic protein [Bartonella sp. 1-1C]CBI80228.1 Hemin binding protein E [Bartonella sp. 1-1C]
MNIKSFFIMLAITSTCVPVVQASGSMSFQEPLSSASSQPSWTGFYIGGQISSFSSTVAASSLDFEAPLVSSGGGSQSSGRNNKWALVDPKFLPKPLGIRGGIYAGSNVDLGNNLVVGVDTDIMWSGKEDTRTFVIDDNSLPTYRSGGESVDSTQQPQMEATVVLNPIGGFRNKRVMYHYMAQATNNAHTSIVFNHCLKEKWTGATRVRIGFAADRIMPYIAAGVSYAELQDTLSVLVSRRNAEADEEKKMVGYTFGGGFDIALAKSFIMRTEYRYSDFGKKKFAKGEVELSYKTNDFRVGVAYKF